MTDTSCAFVPCDQVTRCALVDGGRCLRQTKPHLFPAGRSATSQEALKANAPALNGTKAGRTNRDPALIRRHRQMDARRYPKR